MGQIRRILYAILVADDEPSSVNPEQVFVQKIREVARQVALETEAERFGPRP